MRRTLATLTVVGALLFSAGATLADDTSEANELFVEAAKLLKSVEAVALKEAKTVVLEEALGKLNEIVEDYPSTDLAVKLISGQNIGAISLDGVTAAVEYYRMLEKPPEPNTQLFNYLLASVADAPPLSRMLEISAVNQIAALIKSKVEKNWSVPAGIRDAGQQIVTIRIRLGRDGAVQSADILDDNYANDANFRTMAESARRAVLKASPFSALKRFSDDYDQWRDVTMIFRPPV
jgi:uncharacterized protein (UPF0147 family)